MRKRLPVIFTVVSMVLLAAGLIWSKIATENNVGFELRFFGWIATLLVVGYFSTPVNSIFGKVAFGFVVIMIAGIVMKILHYPGGNESIVAGLLGILFTYAVTWFRKKA